MTPKEAYKLAYMWHRWLKREERKVRSILHRDRRTAEFQIARGMFYKNGFGRQWEAAEWLIRNYWLPF